LQTKNISLSQSKLIRALKQKKYRQKYNNFICEGVKICKELVAQAPDFIELVVVREDQLEQDWAKEMIASHVSIVSAEVKAMKDLSSLEVGSEVMAVCRKPDFGERFEPCFTFYLDGIRDPGNMGTIIRCADWYGITRIYMGEGCVDPFNPKVVQASMGSLFRVELASASIHDLAEGWEVIGTALDGEEKHEPSTKKPLLLVLGSESHGVSEEVRAVCHQLWRLPSRSLGAESLNVAMTAAIFASRWAIK
jgi:TrmH family RNA methyltransferase